MHACISEIKTKDLDGEKGASYCSFDETEKH